MLEKRIVSLIGGIFSIQIEVVVECGDLDSAHFSRLMHYGLVCTVCTTELPPLLGVNSVVSFYQPLSFRSSHMSPDPSVVKLFLQSFPSLLVQVEIYYLHTPKALTEHSIKLLI